MLQTFCDVSWYGIVEPIYLAFTLRFSLCNTSSWEQSPCWDGMKMYIGVSNFNCRTQIKGMHSIVIRMSRQKGPTEREAQDFINEILDTMGYAHRSSKSVLRCSNMWVCMYIIATFQQPGIQNVPSCELKDYKDTFNINCRGWIVFAIMDVWPVTCFAQLKDKEQESTI